MDQMATSMASILIMSFGLGGPVSSEEPPEQRVHLLQIDELSDCSGRPLEHAWRVGWGSGKSRWLGTPRSGLGRLHRESGAARAAHRSASRTVQYRGCDTLKEASLL